MEVPHPTSPASVSTISSRSSTTSSRSRFSSEAIAEYKGRTWKIVSLSLEKVYVAQMFITIYKIFEMSIVCLSWSVAAFAEELYEICRDEEYAYNPPYYQPPSPIVLKDTPYAFSTSPSIANEPSAETVGGLGNSGSSCFMNAVFQSLNAIPEFIDYVDSTKNCLVWRNRETDKIKEEEPRFQLRVNIQSKLKVILETIREKKSVTFSQTDEIRALIHAYNPLISEKFIQEDAQELYLTLADILNLPEVIYQVTYTYQNAYWPKEYPTKHCQEHSGTLIAKIEKEEVAKKHNLRDILIKQIDRERETFVAPLIGKEAEGCSPLPPGTTVTEEISLKIPLDTAGRPVEPQKLPVFIPIQFSRFGSSHNKSFAYVTPPEEIKLPIKDHPMHVLKATLVSVTVHHGYTIGGGHYIALLKQKIADKMQWVYCSDSQVGICQKEDQVEQDISFQGYLYFYKVNGIVLKG